MNLSDVFSAVAYKSFVRVDLPGGSHQHEINGSATLKKFFGVVHEISGPVDWFYFADDRETLRASGDFKYYDARARGANRTQRTEWRLYYTGDFLECAKPGDLFVLARDRKDRTCGLVFQQDSAWLRSVKVLFEIEEPESQLMLVPAGSLSGSELEFAKRRILEELGIEVEVAPQLADEELVAQKFGFIFPSTAEMSDLARVQVEPDPSDPDGTLVAWIEREEQLFKALEKIVVGARLKTGFENVDDFVNSSLSVHQRRKSRMGYAFEHHLGALFDAYHIRYQAHAITEGNNQPDFLFPGDVEYHDSTFDPSHLFMLAAKSTCKDRWRQVLTEADRISTKHLCTLEHGISTAQTNEMRLKRVALVIPKKLHSTYTDDQRVHILSLMDFIELLQSAQIS